MIIKFLKRWSKRSWINDHHVCTAYPQILGRWCKKTAFVWVKQRCFHPERWSRNWLFIIYCLTVRINCAKLSSCFIFNWVSYFY